MSSISTTTTEVTATIVTTEIIASIVITASIVMTACIVVTAIVMGSIIGVMMMHCVTVSVTRVVIRSEITSRMTLMSNRASGLDHVLILVSLKCPNWHDWLLEVWLIDLIAIRVEDWWWQNHILGGVAFILLVNFNHFNVIGSKCLGKIVTGSLILVLDNGSTLLCRINICAAKWAFCILFKIVLQLIQAPNVQDVLRMAAEPHNGLAVNEFISTDAAKVTLLRE